MGRKGLYKTVVRCCQGVLVYAVRGEPPVFLGGQRATPSTTKSGLFGGCLCVRIVGRGTMHFSSMRTGKQLLLRELFFCAQGRQARRRNWKRIPKDTEGL
jgi:hypothetical protein